MHNNLSCSSLIIILGPEFLAHFHVEVCIAQPEPLSAALGLNVQGILGEAFSYTLIDSDLCLLSQGSLEQKWT